MKILLDASVLGVEVDVVYDASTRVFVRDAVPDAFFTRRSVQHPGLTSINDLVAVNGLSIDTGPPENHAAALHACGAHDHAGVLWSHALPRDVWVRWSRSILNRIIDTTSRCETSYYNDVFAPASQFLGSLVPSRVDRNLFRELSERDDANPSLFTFDPGPSGDANPVVYDRFKTRTGRLVVSSGPRILTLPKECRKIFKSRHAKGAIVMFDYVSFEAQVLLASIGKAPLRDVYDSVVNEVFGGEVPREVAKSAVLGMMFGIGREALGEATGMRGKQLDSVMRGIASYFDVNRFQADLMSKLTDGRIHNRFGRSIAVPDGSRHLIVNSFVQSTAVDAALAGFSAMVARSRDAGMGIDPLYVIHDALVCDVHDVDDTEVIASMASHINGFEEEHVFPCKATRIT